MATKRQIAKAGRLWGLALIAHTDNTEGDLPEANDIREAARGWAVQELLRLGFAPHQLLNEADCLQAVSA